MVAGALEVAVVRGPFLLAVRFADGAVHIEDQLLGWLSLMDLVDPPTADIHHRREVALSAERPGLESAHFAG